ncbi:uncharacterized protein DDB_G0290587-like [Clytia hemisphaerica]|uniref:Cnidarian restricted protein n=1 Tax=Clytia hemisphaerica TaxID=252671 RepID=A0A7M5XB98_9CNID
MLLTKFIAVVVLLDGALGLPATPAPSTTAAPAITTAAPGVSTAAPGVTTAAPGVTTAAPGVTTVAPGVTTAAPGVTTSAPGVTTATPATTTKVAPATTTEFTLPPTEPGSDSSTLVDQDLTSTSSSVHTSNGFSVSSGSKRRRRRRDVMTSTAPPATTQTITYAPTTTPFPAPSIFLRLGGAATGDVSTTTIPRNIVESSYNCQCNGIFGNIDWAALCQSQKYCLSFVVRRSSAIDSPTTTIATQTFTHYQGVSKSYTSTDFPKNKWLRITQDINGKCDQLTGKLEVSTAPTDFFDVGSFAIHGKPCAEVQF